MKARLVSLLSRLLSLSVLVFLFEAMAAEAAAATEVNFRDTIIAFFEAALTVPDALTALFTLEDTILLSPLVARLPLPVFVIWVVLTLTLTMVEASVVSDIFGGWVIKTVVETAVMSSEAGAP